jgi:glycosyltransferase involved in cell wall biosynthesis
MYYVPFHDARKWQREGLRTRDAHICHELLRRQIKPELLVLNRPTCLAEVAKLRGRWRTAGVPVRKTFLSQLTAVPEGYLAADCLIPELGLRHGSFHVWVAGAYGSVSYERVIARLANGQPKVDALWVCHPFGTGVLRWNPGVRVLLDAFDNFSTHPELSLRARCEAEHGYRVLAERADRITVNSVALQTFLWQAFKRDALVVPNGVDPTAFEGATPMDLKGTERPVIGYAGKLGRRLDVELIAMLSGALRRGVILLAGPILNRRSVRGLFRLQRVRYVGDLHYRDLPGFLAACDVCIVPHRVGEGENGGDPTKIYEYLAAGKPVVTAAVEGTRAFAGRVAVVATRSEFVEATLAAARGEQVGVGLVRDDETWEARTQAICAHFALSG